jgi:hypothetical protein
MSSLMPRLDRVTRAFWRAVGRPVDLAGEHAWLDAPMHAGPVVGDAWLADAAASYGGRVVDGDPDAGLLADLAGLDGPGFRAADLRPEVRDFYERTGRWRMEVWTQWTPVFQPGGEAVSRLFGRRVQQLALPTRPLDVAHGMDSRVAVLTDAAGDQRAAAWIRSLRSTGEYVYSGCYSSRLLPGSDRPSVHVTFPLEEGNVQVFLRPRVLPGGDLELSSPSGAFGSDGAYVVVRVGGRVHAARAPIHETFTVYVDRDGVLRTDHDLRLWAATAVRLHYKLEPLSAGAEDRGLSARR